MLPFGFWPPLPCQRFFAWLLSFVGVQDTGRQRVGCNGRLRRFSPSIPSVSHPRYFSLRSVAVFHPPKNRAQQRNRKVFVCSPRVSISTLLLTPSHDPSHGPNIQLTPQLPPLTACLTLFATTVVSSLVRARLLQWTVSNVSWTRIPSLRRCPYEGSST